jgi:hypothetical protein
VGEESRPHFGSERNVNSTTPGVNLGKSGTASDGPTFTVSWRPFAGHTDWRLPTVEELQSILDLSKNSPAIDPIFGPTQDFYYWSNTNANNLQLSNNPHYALA